MNQFFFVSVVNPIQSCISVSPATVPKCLAPSQPGSTTITVARIQTMEDAVLVCTVLSTVLVDDEISKQFHCDAE